MLSISSSTRSVLFAVLLVSNCVLADDSPPKSGAISYGNIADACATSAMTAGILGTLRDKGVSQSEAEKQVIDLLREDANKRFFIGLTVQNSEIVFKFPAVTKSSQEQIALARCARFAKEKPTLTSEQVNALIPAVLDCQSSKESALPAPKCVFSAVYQSSP